MIFFFFVSPPLSFTLPLLLLRLLVLSVPFMELGAWVVSRGELPLTAEEELPPETTEKEEKINGGGSFPRFFSLLDTIWLPFLDSWLPLSNALPFLLFRLLLKREKARAEEDFLLCIGALLFESLFPTLSLAIEFFFSFCLFFSAPFLIFPGAVVRDDDSEEAGDKEEEELFLLLAKVLPSSPASRDDKRIRKLSEECISDVAEPLEVGST